MEWAKGLALWSPSPECETNVHCGDVRPKRFGIFVGKLGNHTIFNISLDTRVQENRKKQIINVSLLLFLLLLRNNWVKRFGAIFYRVCFFVWIFGI